MGLALLVGTITLVDLRTLGLGMRRQTVSELAAQLAPWTRAGLVVMLTTGAVLFSADVTRYDHNPAFRMKMVFLLLALVSHFTIHRHAGKLAAILSLTLWTCVVIGGRGIADFDV